MRQDRGAELVAEFVELAKSLIQSAAWIEAQLGLDSLRIRTPVPRSPETQKLHSEKAVLFKCLPSPGQWPNRILARTKIDLAERIEAEGRFCVWPENP